MKLSELDELEKLYEVNIQVYNLAPSQTHGEEEEEETRPDIAATLLRRSHRNYKSTLYLNISPTSKISPATVNRFNVPIVASTGKAPIS